MDMFGVMRLNLQMKKRMSIKSLFICEEARRTGLGQLLMNKAKEIAINDGCNSIGTHYASFNTAAGKFYSKNGFESTRVEMVHMLKNKRMKKNKGMKKNEIFKSNNNRSK